MSVRAEIRSLRLLIVTATASLVSRYNRYKAGLKELEVLQKLQKSDPRGRYHCVQFVSSFKHRNHLCLVFEHLAMNLREVQKRFGRNKGLSLKAVQSYAHQVRTGRRVAKLPTVEAHS